VYGEEAFRINYGDIVPVSADRVIQPGDKDTLDFQGRPLLFLDTPGHAKHHFCIFDEHSKSFFTGDAFGISYREFDTKGEVFIFATTTPVQFEPHEMHNSIVRLLSYQPAKIYLTHYGEVTDVPKLADKLHDSIDTQVTLMDAVTESGEGGHEVLVESLWNYFWMELKQLKCPLPAKTCRELLAMDIELNAQGLEVWWKKG
jgi:glyoxylase-like metal-dependent hydrolase (beta-lactamase superfamily II)